MYIYAWEQSVCLSKFHSHTYIYVSNLLKALDGTQSKTLAQGTDYWLGRKHHNHTLMPMLCLEFLL